MRNSCAVCSLAVVFCLVVCVSANAQVTQEDAKAAVAAAKKSVTEVRVRAENALNDAQSLLDKVESAKNKAEAAASKSQTAATGNTEAVEIAKTIKSFSDDVAASYPAEQQQLDTAVKSLTLLLDEAKRLEAEPEITITPNAEQEDDYTETKGKATALQGKATAFDGQIDAAVKPIAGVESTANTMESNAKKAQLKDAHVSVIVAVATIGTILGKADTTIGQIERNKNEVSGIVEEMKTLKTNNSTVSDKNIEALHQSAVNALRDATDALDSAKISRAAIQTQKGIANEALTKVQPETQEVSEAQKEVQKAEKCVRAAEQSVLQLEAALATVTNSVTSAKDLKQNLTKALSTTTTEQNTQQTNEKEETNLPVADSTDSHQKDTTIQPTSKYSPSQSDNSKEKLKETLINGAQNVPTTALTGGKAPAPGAKNDSAMTVSVPLLVALIASAVLQ